ncbi:MAG: Gldg family protein [Gammaproteobacteria bacterium]|nr:Gldg family protein [Gammaproteobacteria bacterium]
MLKIQSALFVVLLLLVAGLTAWLSNRYVIRFDWTAAQRNSLSEASKKLLDQIDGPVKISAYAREERITRQAIRELVERYQAHKPDIELVFVNPDRNPDEVRRLAISSDRELVVRYSNRSANVKSLNESNLTNALFRVARSEDRRIVYLKGHGERDLLGDTNHDLGKFGQQLENRGFKIIALNLTETGAIPENSDTLLLTAGEVDWLEGELAMIAEYISRGGNVLWLSDPEPSRSSLTLSSTLGVTFFRGRVIEPTTRAFGVNDPDIVVVNRYGAHPSTQNFNLITVFPGAVAMTASDSEDWRSTALLLTSGQSWSETGAINRQARPDHEDEASGPLQIGLALSRQLGSGQESRQQRVVIIGDGDFLSNSYLVNAGNLQLGLNLVNWLADDDVFIDIPVTTAPDLEFGPSAARSLVIAFVPLAVVPVALLAAGFFVWRLRRS